MEIEIFFRENFHSSQSGSKNKFIVKRASPKMFKSMHYNVPQFIDIEDRLVGPLTAKQLLWLFGLGAALFVLWALIENKTVFFICAVPVGLIFLAMAFYRPYGQPLSKFISSMFMFFVRPKVYLWKRTGERMKMPKQEIKNVSAVNPREKKVVKQKEIYDLSKILDSETDILNEINRK